MNQEQNGISNPKSSDSLLSENIQFVSHLKYLGKLEDRKNRFPTYNFAFKCEMEPSKIEKVKNEIKINNKLLQSKPKNVKGNTQFKEQFEQLRKLETERLKDSNQNLKNEMKQWKNNPNKYYELNMQRMKRKNADIIAKGNIIPMRFKNPYPY